jgi:hypothetical protein
MQKGYSDLTWILLPLFRCGNSRRGSDFEAMGSDFLRGILILLLVVGVEDDCRRGIAADKFGGGPP